MLIARKLCLVCIAELTGRNAMFQASLALGVICISYMLQAKYKPFVTSESQALAIADHTIPARAQGDARVAQVRRLSHRLGRRDSGVTIDLAVAKARGVLSGAKALLDFNVLESTLLGTSMGVLLGGMMFESSQLVPGVSASCACVRATFAVWGCWWGGGGVCTS